MFSVAPNIVLAPNMTQNAERKHRTQNTNTAHIRLRIEGGSLEAALTLTNSTLMIHKIR